VVHEEKKFGVISAIFRYVLELIFKIIEIYSFIGIDRSEGKVVGGVVA
jgi:hypothetical protein